MQIHQPGIYHIYNRGNNQQKIFFDKGNYIYFLDKCHRYLKPVSDIFAWCLMPNHFHFLLEVTHKSLVPFKCGGLTMPAITNGFRILQSGYTKGINLSKKRTGNLFQQKTKAKMVNEEEDYSLTAFSYIHQNPVKANLVKYPGDWAFSSFNEYAYPNENNLSNIIRAKEVLGVTAAGLLNTGFQTSNDNDVGFIF